jgi:hypothetical protein
VKIRIAVILALLAGLCAVPTAASAAVLGTISGTVTQSAEPAEGAFVGVLGIVDTGFFGKGPTIIGDATTDASGHYTVTDLAPSTRYWVCVVPADWLSGPGSYDSKCYEQTDTWFAFPSGAGFLAAAPGSRPLSLLPGQHRNGVDVDLQQPPSSVTGGIYGRVTAFGLVPLRHATVTVEQNGIRAGAALTASNGTYRIAGLAPGSYRVCFDGSSTAPKYGSTCRKALVAVRAGVVTKGIPGVVALRR